MTVDVLEPDLVKAFIFNTLSCEERAVLLDDDHLEATYEGLRQLVAATHAQLEEYNARVEAGAPENRDWRRRVVFLHTRANKRLSEVKPLLKDLRRRRNNELRQTRASLFYSAICRHRTAILSDPTLDPSPADEELWAVLELADAPT